MIQETRETGFQEEKYKPLYLPVRWTKEQLFKLLDARVNKLVHRQYTKERVSWADLMPAKINGKQPVDDYLIERTMYRPRDLIVFFNACIEQAVDMPEITAKTLHHAEEDYSKRRLDSIDYEWSADYPELRMCADLLKKKPPRFPLSAITADDIKDKCLTIATRSAKEGKGDISNWAARVVDETMTPDECRARLACVFYRVGLVGVKIETYKSDSWSFLHSLTISESQLQDDTQLTICPMFYRVLGVSPDSKGARPDS